MRFAFLIPPMMLLAACGQGEEKKDKTEVSINAGDEHGGVQITAGKDGNGRIKIGGDGVGIDMKIPDFVDLDVEGAFDIDGVKLYPGSNVTTVNVDATDKNGQDRATVKLGFTSPATPAKAADWMGGVKCGYGFNNICSFQRMRSGSSITRGNDVCLTFAQVCIRHRMGLRRARALPLDPPQRPRRRVMEAPQLPRPLPAERGRGRVKRLARAMGRRQRGRSIGASKGLILMLWP